MGEAFPSEYLLKLARLITDNDITEEEFEEFLEVPPSRCGKRAIEKVDNRWLCPEHLVGIHPGFTNGELGKLAGFKQRGESYFGLSFESASCAILREDFILPILPSVLDSSERSHSSPFVPSGVLFKFLNSSVYCHIATSHLRFYSPKTTSVP